MLCEIENDLHGRELIITLAKYNQGCAQNSISDLQDPTALVERALAQELLCHFSERDQRVLKSFSLARTQGLTHTHQENFFDAEDAFAHASRVIQANESSDECQLLCKSFLGQSQSYLDYRKGDFNEAREKIIEAINYDVVLENQYGFRSLFLHRVHLVHNLVRVYAKHEQLEDAIKLSCEILNYLGGFSSNISVHSDWDWQKLFQQSHDHIAILFNGVVNELAIILSGQEKNLQQRLFANISRELILDSNQKEFHLDLEHWLALKKSFVNRDVDTFLSLVQDFLSFQKTKNSILWYIATIDLLIICHELNSPSSIFIKDQIIKSVSSLIATEQLPSKIYHLLTSLNCQKEIII